ncbi:hematopoietic death receptor isoform X3 [Myripristis murdjan]|uniref:hematopoietic death receptor isoform X3 n=1 Tax=Myripristis murdjan TaxID=586833 RepID=UPI001175F103|nr:tumor necrosis factor receptor superfamily member 10B-like isoform X3 [Myripristis murdjan]
MTNTSYMVVSILMWLLKATVALQQSGLELGGRGGNRTQRDVSCTDNMEYLHINICCLKCPAGTYVKSPCTKAGQSGKCEECDYEMYTEHDNGLHQCLRCTKCRFDQEIVRPCLSTQNTECQCRSGWFCAPDQACEVCKKCSRCEEDEVKVRNCTAVSDTQCKKGRSGSGFASASVAAVIVPVVISAVIFGIIVAFVCRRRCRRPTDIFFFPDPESNPPNRLKEVLENEPFPNLVPVNGEESLRNCFEYFEEMDFDYHKRFFRQLGIKDNVIKSKDHLQHEDRIHELLNSWIEKVGKEASLNDLLKVLLTLNQRLTAENIMVNATSNGHYVFEKE